MEQIIYPDHVYVPQSFEDLEMMTNINEPNNKEPSMNGFLNPQDQGLTEIGNIMIPFYFENNNVYSRNPIFDQSQVLQTININNMLSLNSENNFNQFSPPKTFLTQAEPQYNFSTQEINNLTLSHMFGSVLESPFPSPNLMGVNIQTTTTLPYIALGGDSQNYTRHPTPLYETDSQPQNEDQTSSLCSQKPPVYTKWTEEEDERLRAAINIYGPHKWSLIAAHVPNRTPMQCSTRWLGALNPTIHKGRWTPEEDAALKGSVSEYVDILDSDGHPMPIPWNKIASRIPHRTGIQCQARWSEALDPSVRKGKWSPEEDEVLKEGVRRYGRCWIRIAELIDGRTQRQCRTRWVQIKNKQAKAEREATAAKANATASTDDENNEILTPPHTTPSTPAQTRTSPAILQGPISHVTSTMTKNQTPSMSPTETNATDSCSCIPIPGIPSPPPYNNKNINHSYIFTYLP